MTYTYETNLDGETLIEVDIKLEKGMILEDISNNEEDGYFRIRKIEGNELFLKQLKQPQKDMIPFNRLYRLTVEHNGMFHQIHTYSNLNAMILYQEMSSNGITIWRY